jgi:hypothetical protein
MTQQEFDEMVTRVMNLLDRAAARAADCAPFNNDMALLAGNIQLLIGALQQGDMVELSSHVEKFLDKKLAERRGVDRRAGLAVEDLIKSIGGINLN